MLTEADIFVYAKQQVDNKTIFQRIAHAPKLHDARSMFSSPGSFASKGASLLGAGARKAFSAIPIPMLPSLLAAVEEAAQKAITKAVKRSRHKKQVAGATGDQQTALDVKFKLKDLSVEELDRFRWKVDAAMKDLNKALTGFNNSLSEARAAGATCDAFLELAVAEEQANRRIAKLRARCDTLKAVLNLTTGWLDGLEKGLIAEKNNIQDNLKDTIGTYQTLDDKTKDALHESCSKWCFHKDLQAPDNHQLAKDRAATVLRVLASPFTLESAFDLTSDSLVDVYKPNDIGSVS